MKCDLKGIKHIRIVLGCIGPGLERQIVFNKEAIKAQLGSLFIPHPTLLSFLDVPLSKIELLE